MSIANASKKAFVSGVTTSYELAGWVLLGLSALIGIPPFYDVLKRMTDDMFGALQLPSALNGFLSQVAWGLSILACAFVLSKLWRTHLPLLSKFGLMAFVAFIGFTLFSSGSGTTIDLLVALAIWGAGIFTWVKIQSFQLVPFIIFHNRNAAERAASQIDTEDAKGGGKLKGSTDADRIRALATANDSMTKQLQTACLLAFFAYVVEGAVNMLKWMPDPLGTLGKLWQGLFTGGFWQILGSIALQIAWIGLTCALTEIAALKLIGTEKISELMKVNNGSSSQQPRQSQQSPSQQHQSQQPQAYGGLPR